MQCIGTRTDGLGKKVRFDYAAPGDGTVYAADALDPNNQVIALTYPLRRTPRMGALVRAMRTSNGQGGWLETQYKYAGAARDMTGRGYAGFARVDTTDVASGITAAAPAPSKPMTTATTPPRPSANHRLAGQTLWQAAVQDAAQRTTNAIFGNDLAEQQPFNPYSARLPPHVNTVAGQLYASGENSHAASLALLD